MSILQQVKDSYQVHSLFTVHSLKAIKGIEYGYLNGIQYLPQHLFAFSYGIPNMCAFATKGCSAMCFGNVKRFSMHYVNRARINRAKLFHANRDLYIEFFKWEVQRLIKKAKKDKLKLALRLNGTSDKNFNKIGLYSMFPAIQFCEYTKSPILVKQYLNGELPDNLHITFSRSEKNEDFCIECLNTGKINVAIPFLGPLPETWKGFPVIDGDTHDLRFLDPKGGHVVGLSFKGWKKQFQEAIDSGFIIDNR
jgi:hypothetical protein